MLKSRLGYLSLFLALLFFGAALIIFPERYVGCCFQGFALWAECVLPSLFPFMVVALLAVKTGLAEKASLPLKRITGRFHLPPAAAACFLMSVCSGYPAGSRVLCEFYESGALTKDDCGKLAGLCSTSGPLFIIGSVGFKMFGDKTAGVKILLAHVFAVTAVSLLMALFSKKSSSNTERRAVADKNVLYNTFYGAVVSVAVAGGFIAFFYVLAQFAADFCLLYPLQRLFGLFLDGQTSSALCAGLLEATTGCNALAACEGKLRVALAGFIITFGGLSILMQQLGYLTKTGVKPLKFVGIKFVQAVLCFLLLLLIA